MVPQFLPHMHERYFFLADVLAIMLAVWNPIYWSVALILQVSSSISYISFLWGTKLLDQEVPFWLRPFGFTNNLQPITGLLAIASIVNLFMLIWLWRRLHRIQVASAITNHFRS